MEKVTWLNLTPQEKSAKMNFLLLQIVEIDKQDKLFSQGRAEKPNQKEKFRLENEVLQILDFEKEDHEVA